MDSQAGPGWLAEWATLWAKGTIGEASVQLWGRATLVPLVKPDGKVRPIALSEALTKLAECLIIESADLHKQRCRISRRQVDAPPTSTFFVNVGEIRCSVAAGHNKRRHTC